jgi:hypothetical protein
MVKGIHKETYDIIGRNGCNNRQLWSAKAGNMKNDVSKEMNFTFML